MIYYMVHNICLETEAGAGRCSRCGAPGVRRLAADRNKFVVTYLYHTMKYYAMI